MRKLENLLTNQDKYINNRYLLFADGGRIITLALLEFTLWATERYIIYL